MMMSKPRRLHPIAVFSNILKQFKELLIPIIAFIAFGSRGSSWDSFYLIASIVGAILVVGTGILSWLRFTYWIEEGELRIEEGIIVRKKRYIPFERIQSLDFSEGIFHRPFGLVKVKAETAGTSGEAEAELTAVKKEEALAIQEILQNIKFARANESERELMKEERKEEILYKITLKELLLLASTSGGVGVIISAIFALIFQFEELIPYEKIFKEFESIAANGFLFLSIVVFLLFLLVWVLAVIGTMVKYANFTLKKVDDDFIITRGLLEKRQLTIPLKRIQAVRISENLLRQPLKLASVFIESAGGSAEDVESARVSIVPLVKKARIREIVEAHLDDYTLIDPITPVPRRALKRYIVRDWLPLLPIVLILFYFLRLWGLLALTLFPLMSLWSIQKYKDACWGIAKNQLTLSYRTLIKHTVFMKRNRIQAFHTKTSFFQRKVGLSTITATVKSGAGGTGGTVVDLEKNDAAVIYQWYSRSHQLPTYEANNSE